MSDQPADPAPPRVEVRPPGGRTLPGRLLRWRQGDDGRWWGHVLVQVPADAIGRLDGEDYAAVPREPATSHAPYVLEVDSRRPNSGATIHDADCFLLEKPASWARLTPLTAEQARGQMRFPDTSACTVCNPEL